MRVVRRLIEILLRQVGMLAVVHQLSMLVLFLPSTNAATSFAYKTFVLSAGQ
jgi:hypothetical protein